MSTTAILIQARAFLSDPVRWTKGQYYVRKSGVSPNKIDLKPEDIACACSMGALRLYSDWWNYSTMRPYDIAVRMLMRAVNGSIPDFNDSPVTTHKDVLDAFDKAIAKAMVPEFLAFCDKMGDRKYNYGSAEHCAITQFLESIGLQWREVGGAMIAYDGEGSADGAEYVLTPQAIGDAALLGNFAECAEYLRANP